MFHSYSACTRVKTAAVWAKTDKINTCESPAELKMALMNLEDDAANVREEG